MNIFYRYSVLHVDPILDVNLHRDRFPNSNSTLSILLSPKSNKRTDYLLSPPSNRRSVQQKLTPIPLASNISVEEEIFSFSHHIPSASQTDSSPKTNSQKFTSISPRKKTFGKQKSLGYDHVVLSSEQKPIFPQVITERSEIARYPTVDTSARRYIPLVNFKSYLM